MSNKKNDMPHLAPGSSLIDTHCHLDMDAYEKDLEQIVRDAAHRGVTGIITVGIDLESSRKAVALAKCFPGMWATVGIHPHHASDGTPETYEKLKRLVTENRKVVVGYGEIGLDFAKEYAPRDVQRESFDRQLEMAKELNLPVIIHDRDAHEETLDILEAHAPFPALGVMHCFSGDLQLARRTIDLGFYISIPGIVTFKNSSALQQVAREIPLDKIILETDGPFLAPVPFRGKTNRPEYLLYTALKIAELRGSSLDDIARQTTVNAQTLFSLNRKGAARDL